MIAMTTRKRNGNSRITGTMVSEPVPAGNDEIPIDRFVPQEELTSLLPELERHTELGLETMRYHAEQSDATARDGYWHASINEARSFLEALVMSIALVERKESMAQFRKGRETQGGLRLCRRYLQDVGFLDIDEDILVSHVYSIASAKGSHLGVTDEAWCRVGRRMIWTTGQYLAQRYQAWKDTDRRRSVSRPFGGCSTLSGRSALSQWRVWLITAFTRLADNGRTH